MESNLRFDLTICKETNDLQKEIRRTLQEKGYTRKFERHNYFLGSIHFNTATEYFIKGNTLFEVERDLERNMISAVLHYYPRNGKKEHRSIPLGDILKLA